MWATLGLGVLMMTANSAPAYVFEHVDQWTGSAHARQLLSAAGFSVRDLPVDSSPLNLDNGLILFGSFSCEDPRYATYMERYGNDLQGYIAKGNVVVQLTQADQFEVSPPFLPASLSVVRTDPDYGTVHVIAPDHPLLEGIEERQISFHATRTVWEVFGEQSGFRVLMSADDQGGLPALMEAAVGKGRLLMAALPLDKDITPRDRQSEEQRANQVQFGRSFFANLARYVQMVQAGDAPEVRPTPSQSDARRVAPGSWSLIVLPDTQVYAETFPGMFTAQTGWIVQNRRRLDIRYVLHLGDIVNRNTRREWQNAYDAMSLLHGHVPYALAPGNHDYGPGGNASTRDTYLNEFFPFEESSAWPTFGGAFEPGKLDNTYHLFEAGGRNWIVIALEWAPRDEAVAWADAVMSRYPNHTGILITHAYLYSDSTRYDWPQFGAAQRWNPHSYATPGSKNDGEQLWQKLVRKHNFAFTLNGHVLNNGTGHLASRNDRGTTTHQILVNYQTRALGGEGYLRIMEFSPDGQTVRMKSYSPVYDRFMLSADQNFEVVLD